MIINLETIKTRLPELEQLWTLKSAASESYADAVKLSAEQAKCDPTALRAYINARMRDKMAKLQIQQEQLSLMLEMPDE